MTTPKRKWHLEEDVTHETELDAMDAQAEAQATGLFARVTRKGLQVKCWRREPPKATPPAYSAPVPSAPRAPR